MNQEKFRLVLTLSRIEKRKVGQTTNPSVYETVKNTIAGLQVGRLHIVELFQADLFSLHLRYHEDKIGEIALMAIDARKNEMRIAEMVKKIQNRNQAISILALSKNPEGLENIDYSHLHIFPWPIPNQKEFSEKVFALLKDTTKD